jgi:DNA integrity scanning protein DisA with diadenylate cyclase activity
MSRGICEGVYADQVSELQCIKKIKQGPNTDDPLNRARDTWLRMLQQVPRISETKARNIVQHYPTMQSLWQAYQDCDDEAENAGRLANVFDGKSQQMKVSETLYRFMTSENPNELL